MKINVQDVSINPGELEKIISSLETAISRNTRVKELCEEILEVKKSSTSGLRKNGGKGEGGRRNKRLQGGKTLAHSQSLTALLKNAPPGAKIGVGCCGVFFLPEPGSGPTKYGRNRESARRRSHKMTESPKPLHAPLVSPQ